MQRWRPSLAMFAWRCFFFVVWTTVAAAILGEETKSTGNTAGNKVQLIKGPRDLRSIFESNPHPSIVRFDPLGCTDVCRALDEFLDQAALHFGDRIFVWKLQCDYHFFLCKHHALPPLIPFFAAWTNVGFYHGVPTATEQWQFVAYDGNYDLNSLLLWIRSIASLAPPKSSSPDSSLDAMECVWGADTVGRTCRNIESTTPPRSRATKVPSKITQNYGELPIDDHDNPLLAMRMTSLAYAAFSGDLPLVQEILHLLPLMSSLEQKAAVIEHRNMNGATPLMLAAQQGHVRVVRCLIEQAGADVDAQDRFDATPLLAAVSLGHVEIVQLLLMHGASMDTATSHFSFSLTQLAQQEGHVELAAFLAPVEDRLRRDYFEATEHRELSSRTTETGLPPGMEVTYCGRRMNLTHARCYLAGLAPASCGSTTGDSYYQMPTINAMTLFCESQTRCLFSPLGMIAKRIVDLLLLHDLPSYRLYSPPRDPETDHSLTWLQACRPAAMIDGTLDTNEDSDNLPMEGDVWPCIFGRAEFVPFVDADTCQSLCDPGNSSSSSSDLYQQSAVSKRDLGTVITGAIVLQGNRTSPLLEPGPTPPPFDQNTSSTSTGLTVSVHVRAGDSCDIVTTAANRTSWALWPFHPQGLRGNDWPKAKRYCVHPQVHLSAVTALHNSEKYPPIGRVLLATDSHDAYNLFREQLNALDPAIELHALSFDRTAFGRPDGTALKMEDFWIEYRSARNSTFAATAMTTALEDLRLLARGSLLIGAMCGMFARAIHAAMIAHNEKEVPVLSVDRCQPICTEEGIQYTHFDRGRLV